MYVCVHRIGLPLFCGLLAFLAGLIFLLSKLQFVGCVCICTWVSFSVVFFAIFKKISACVVRA